MGLKEERESGAIEQDADIVCFIHRPEYYKIMEDAQGNSLLGIAEIIIAKHRSGATDDVQLRFIAKNAKFANLNEGSAYEFDQMNIPKTMGSKINDETSFYEDSISEMPNLPPPSNNPFGDINSYNPPF